MLIIILPLRGRAPKKKTKIPKKYKKNKKPKKTVFQTFDYHIIHCLIFVHTLHNVDAVQILNLFQQLLCILFGIGLHFQLLYSCDNKVL